MKLKLIAKMILVIFLINTATCFQTLTETDTKAKNQINISIGKMKLKKMQKTGEKTVIKQPTAAIAPSATVGGSGTINDQLSSTGNLAKTSNLYDVATKTSAEQDPYALDFKIGDGPIFFTAWMKYFKYVDTDQNGAAGPKSFFKNNYYYDQMKVFPNANLGETSSDGVSTLNTYIKSPTHFYVVLFKKNLNFVSSRQTRLQKTFDAFNIDSINAVDEQEQVGGNKNNGIQDFGNFSEGFCFKVLTHKPRIETWVMCADTKDEKEKLMTFLRKIKITEQRDNGLIVNGKPKEDTISDILNPDMGGTQNLRSDEASNLGIQFNSTQKITDGYWIILQDWTQCSLKCGGGTSTLQRMCIPPKNGGAPCQGEAIMTKPCNPKPCPLVTGTDPLKNNNTIVHKPIIKVMPFTNRPQRYSKCVLKESDLMLSTDIITNPDEPIDPRTTGDVPKNEIPVRVVMNNRTIIIFGGDDYETEKHTFSLSDTFFKRSLRHNTCFVLSEGKNTAELCPFGFGSSGGKNMIEEWDYDFNLFKHQCFKPRDQVNLMEVKLQEKIQEAKKQVLMEREEELRTGAQKVEEAKIETVIKTTNNVALQAIQKELNLEEMIRKEEAEREKTEEIEMLQQIEAEKKKSECMMRAIKERELENQYNLRAKQAQDEVENIKQAASQQVLIRRSQLKNQIAKMRKDALRRKSSLAQQLQTVRNSMAETMGVAYKKGDSGKCKKAMENKEERESYCEANFAEDYDGLQFCKDGDEFCNSCCDMEFGQMFIHERQSCYKDICTPGAVIGDVASGRWMWQSEISKK